MTAGNEMVSRLLRGGGARDVRPRRWLALAVSAFVAASLLLLSRIDHPLTKTVRWQVNDAAQPLLQAVALPVAPLRALADRAAALKNADTEIQRLRSELAEARRAMAEASVLRRSIADLSGVAHLVREAQLPYVTARVLAASSSNAAPAGVVVASGRDQGVRLGFPVVNGDGLVGRVVEVGRSVARVVLASDRTSRIPVVIGHHGGRAMMVGDGASMPRIEHLEEGARPAAGDVVTTSTAGGFLPNGLPVGEVVIEDGAPRIRLNARLDRLDYVSVLSYDNPALGLIEGPAQINRFANRRANGSGDDHREGR